jgi:hypothetical protein
MTQKTGDKGNFERVGEGVGSMAGKAADTAVDLMSSMLRTAASTFGGWWSRSTPDDAARSFGAEQDRTCRTHFENLQRSGGAGSSYDNVRPLYQFGHLAGSNPDYQGRSFAEVENELQRTWTPEHSSRYGDWNQVRDYINTGYTTHSRGGNLP